MTIESIKKNKYLYLVWAMISYFSNKILNFKSTLKSLYVCLIYFRSFRVILLNHLTIGIDKLHKSKVKFPHPVGIVIGKGVIIGNNCTIYQNVTIGAKNSSGVEYPELGNNVIVYANTCIVGNVKIGDNVIIGACSLVLDDIPPNAIAVGSPAKVISYNKS